MLLCTYVNLKNQFFISSSLSFLSSSLSLSTLIKALAGMEFVFRWLPWDSVAGFSPPSQSWLQTKWVVVGLGLQRENGGCGFGFASVGVGVMGGCHG